MNVITIDTTNPRQVRQFCELPFKIYRDFPLWVPPIETELKQIMNRSKHPYYLHSDAEFFMVEDNSELLGRIAVLHNRNFCNHHDQKTAFFYYFECVENAEAARLLLLAATDWARTRGLNLIIGPKGFMRSSGFGLLIQGHDRSPALGIPYNPPYYEKFFDDFGFTKESDTFSGLLNHHLNEKIHLIAEKVAKRGNFSIKTFKNRAEMKKWIPVVEEINREAFKDYPWYYPSTPEEFKHLANNILEIADTRFIKLVMHGDEVAGFILVYPNISAALRRTKGKLFPFGWIDLLQEKKRTRIADINGVGFLPQYQGLGANAFLYTEVEKVLADANMIAAEIVQVEERNFRSKADMDAMEVTWTKTHRLYRLPL